MEQTKETPDQTPHSDKSTTASFINNESVIKLCASTDCEWRFDLLCAPRPRGRSRLNDSGFFEQDTASTVQESDNTVPNVSDDWTAVPDYSDEIFLYLYALEEQLVLPKNFVEHQPEVTYQSRAVLVDWIIQVYYLNNKL